MKLDSSGMNGHERAITLTEVVVLLAVIALYMALVLPALNKGKSKGHPVSCAYNLKEIAVGLRTFSNEHQDRFPWQVSKVEGGSEEYFNSAEVFRHFLAASNELSSPKVLQCPGDKERSKESQWGRFSNSNLSYFVGLEARTSQPASLLAGDRTILLGKKLVSGLVAFNTNALPKIAKGLPGDFINTVSADGRIQQLYDRNVRNWILNGNQLPMRWAVP